MSFSVKRNASKTDGTAFHTNEALFKQGLEIAVAALPSFNCAGCR